MDDRQYELANKLINAIGSNTEYVINEYTVWFITNSLAWIVCGICFVTFALRLKPTSDRDHYGGEKTILRYVILVIGMLVIATHVGDLLAPEAASINQLIRSVKS